ncbi:MAG: UDP-N-acetylmuramate dehydrogenase [Bacillota bacterium]
MKVIENVLTSGFSTLGVGGFARGYLEMDNKSQWGHVLNLISKGNPCEEFFILGGGSNSVFGDFYDGIIIKLKGEFCDIKATGTGYICGGGVNLHKVCNLARKDGLSGLCELLGIFGTVGGGVFGNCGAFGREISDVVEWVEVLTKTGEMRISKSLCGFCYRKSSLPKNSIITRVKFNLEKSTKFQLEKITNACKIARISSQPFSEKSCGSTYKKIGEISPAKLIDMAGLKGYRVGGLEVSKKHAGFIVNIGGGTPCDFQKITREIEDIIFEKYQIKIEKEIKFIGYNNKIQ